jgi:alpha-1,6-mannosyltransferase
MKEANESARDRAATKRFLSFDRVGWLTALVYLGACLFYVRGPQVYTRTAREVFIWLCVLPLLFLFWKGYRLLGAGGEETEGASRAARRVVLFGALFCLLAFLTVPFHSTDVFGYLNRGWQQAHYGLNPYVYRLADTPNWQQDPMLREHWVYNPNPYGFLFSLLARLLCQAGGGNWWLTLSLFKGVNVLAYAFAAWLVWAATARLGRAGRVRSLYLLLWNPLVLMHHVANGHNDILIGCLVALAVFLAVTSAPAWIIPVLVAAALLKYAPVLLIPPALVFVVRRQGWKAAALGCLLGAILVVLASAPYLKDWRLLRLADIKDNATLIDNSLHSFLIHVFENAARLAPRLAPLHEAVDWLIKATLRIGLLLFVLVQWIRVPKDFTAEALARKFVLILYALVCVASSKFNAWYLAMLLPAALMLDERDWLRRLVVLTAGAELLSLTFFKQAYMINYFVMLLLPAWIVFRQVRAERRRGSAGAGAASGHRAAVG